MGEIMSLRIFFVCFWGYLKIGMLEVVKQISLEDIFICDWE